MAATRGVSWLQAQPVPVLYTIGANDNVFSVTKAMECFAAMAGPKHLLIGPNEGHNYWAVPQGILFFDSVLKRTGAGPDTSTTAFSLSRSGAGSMTTRRLRREPGGTISVIPYAAKLTMTPSGWSYSCR